MSTDEPARYTLSEARQILAVEDCRGGHADLHEVFAVSGTVTLIVCTHCGARYVPERA